MSSSSLSNSLVSSSTSPAFYSVESSSSSSAISEGPVVNLVLEIPRDSGVTVNLEIPVSNNSPRTSASTLVLTRRDCGESSRPFREGQQHFNFVSNPEKEIVDNKMNQQSRSVDVQSASSMSSAVVSAQIASELFK